MSEQLALDLFAAPKQRPCIWLEESYGYPHCYLRQTFRVDCDACRERGRRRLERWEREERERKARRRGGRR